MYQDFNESKNINCNFKKETSSALVRLTCDIVNDFHLCRDIVVKLNDVGDVNTFIPSGFLSEKWVKSRSIKWDGGGRKLKRHTYFDGIFDLDPFVPSADNDEHFIPTEALQESHYRFGDLRRWGQRSSEREIRLRHFR